VPIEIALFGTLGVDAELKTSKTGKQYLRARVAVDDGDKTTWLSIRAFDSKAIENAAGYTKGSAVYCEGKLSLDEWTSQTGEQRHGLSVLSFHFRLSQIGRARPRREKAAPKPDAQSAASGSTFDDDEILEWR
jgi:single-stranded DNA-binding protein